MKFIQLFVFVMALNAGQSWLADAGVHGATKVFGAMAIAFAAIALLLAYPQLRFKPEERTLRIGPAGISTTIGKLSGDVPWTSVASFRPETHSIYIVGTRGNSFSVPNRAFASLSARDEFVRLAVQWWSDARAR